MKLGGNNSFLTEEVTLQSRNLVYSSLASLNIVYNRDVFFRPWMLIFVLNLSKSFTQ